MKDNTLPDPVLAKLGKIVDTVGNGFHLVDDSDYGVEIGRVGRSLGVLQHIHSKVCKLLLHLVSPLLHSGKLSHLLLHSVAVIGGGKGAPGGEHILCKLSHFPYFTFQCHQIEFSGLGALIGNVGEVVVVIREFPLLRHYPFDKGSKRLDEGEEHNCVEKIEEGMEGCQVGGKDLYHCTLIKGEYIPWNYSVDHTHHWFQ